MTSPSIPELRTVFEETPSSLSTLAAAMTEPLKGAAFWTAVALPFLYLPLLFATGLQNTTTTAAFVVLLALNVVTLLVGHQHRLE
jgi:hypothetical protein